VLHRVKRRGGCEVGQLTQELARTNPWWRDATWHERDPDLRESRSGGVTYRSDVLAGLSARSLYILRGPRRIGKTVAVKQEIENLLTSGTPATSVVRVAADGWDAKDLRTLLQNTAMPLSLTGQPRYWFIDEVSAVVGPWEQQSKWLRDNDNEFRAATEVLTGSNATALTAAAGALAGRRGACWQRRSNTFTNRVSNVRKTREGQRHAGYRFASRGLPSQCVPALAMPATIRKPLAPERASARQDLCNRSRNGPTRPPTKPSAS
jgi:AAA domain